MQYGKIRVEDGMLIFSKHMIVNNLPCKDILWAYMRREGIDGGAQKQLTVTYLVIVTRRRKRYKFDMTEREVRDCIHLLKVLNPGMAVGYPKGGRLNLQGLPNTRDLGALVASDGRHILPRKLLRSGNLYHTSQADQKMLAEEYHLRTVIDFRTTAECMRMPDTRLPDVKYYHIPILDEETMGISRGDGISQSFLQFEGDADEYMIRQYENFIRDHISVKQYARFLDLLLRQEEGAVLWHCTAGKDRAGVGTVLLLCVLGIPREVIREDFLRTNTYMEGELESFIRFLETRTIVDGRMLNNIRIMYRVKGEYLDAVFRTIESQYGSVELFLRRALYMTPKAIETLRGKYLI